MRMKIGVLIILLGSMVCTSVWVYASDGNYAVTTEPATLVAGVVNEVTISIENIGLQDISSLEVGVVSGTYGAALVRFSSFDVEDFQAESSFEFTLDILVARTLHGSVVSLTVILNPGIRGQAIETFDLGYVVNSKSYLEMVNMDREGKEVTLTLRNPSQVRLSNASVQLEYGGVLVGLPYSAKVQSLDPQENITLYFDLADIYDQVTVAITYDDGWTDRFGVKLLGFAHEIIVDSIERKGDDVTISLTNVGESAEKNMIVSLKYMGAVVGLPYEITIPQVLTGETKEVSFELSLAYQQITLRIKYSDGYIEEKGYSVTVFGGRQVELRCTYPEKKPELGTTVSYPLTVINRGLAGVFGFSIEGLPSVFKGAFIKDETNLQAVYLEEGEQAVFVLVVEVPKIPLNYMLEERIPFTVTAISEGETVDELELGLTPTTSHVLSIYSKGWYGDVISGVQGLHYTGVAYSTGDLALGESITAKYLLNKDTTYIVMLYGSYVGTNSDLNLFLLNENGHLMDVSAESEGKTETIIIEVEKSGSYLLVVSNEETTSRMLGGGVLLVSELKSIPDSSTLELRSPMFETATIVNVTDLRENKIRLEVEGESLTVLLYPFTSNRERTEYDPFISRAPETVESENGRVILEYNVRRVDELVLIQWKSSQNQSLVVKSSIHENTGVGIQLLDQDMMLAAAVLATLVFIVVAIWGEKTLLTKLSFLNP